MDFSPSSEGRQETTRYAGGDKKLNKKLTLAATIELFRPIAERKSELYGKPNEQFGAYQMGVQVSHCIYTEVSQEDGIQPIQRKPAGYHTDAV